ncbi:MAG: methylmalonyl-CoA mutase family protein [Candidatus Alcyoniella australis]|nr:methylmalonyl-CoA mutase family protein [Candidatus Alcyoniella australis]
MPDGIEQGRKAWQEKVVDKTLAKRPERKPDFKTTSDIKVERLYTPLDLEHQDYERDLGFPGSYPYTRGVQPTMFRGRFWTFRQYSGFGDAASTNERFKYLLDHGQTGLSIAFDLPTQMGYDSDNPLAAGEVGKVGVAIDSLDDMRTLFEGIPLDKVSTSMTINSTAAVLLAMYLVLAQSQGVPFDKVRGTIQNDVLKEYMARGTYIFPPSPSMRIISDIFAFCSEQAPQFNTISISGYHIREAGCSAVQEVAFTLADGIAYVRAAIDAGLDVDAFAGRLSFFFNAHNNLIEEVAKFRAARRMWARIMRERFKAKDPRSWTMRFHTQTAGSMLTAQQPDNNVVRVTLQALAAVLGGTQSLHTNSRDEALALPSEQAVTIALRTQQLIAEESGVSETIDPLAGSYFVESLTDQIETKALEYIERIDQMGGMVEAILAGYPQREIQDKAYQWQRAVDADERVVVGVNRYVQQNEDCAGDQEILRVDPRIEQQQVERIAKLRAARDEAALQSKLELLRRMAHGTENLMPPIIEAVRAQGTLGEISNALRDVFGEFQEVIVV